ncbi:MAG: tyrosine-type recombinase/integrase [Gammaproteobacteria bacterium]|nr:tyrosine-type recombinase/integrase [Gammaproteobacteria bacterium]
MGPELNGRKDGEPEPLTLERLFDIYGEEVTPTKAPASQRYDRATMAMFLRLFGRDRRANTLSQRDWDRFIWARRAGKAGRSGRPAANRTIQQDLKLLLAILNWAARSRDEEGSLLLESNPLRGLKTPTEKNPTRVLLTDAEYQALLRASEAMDWRFRVALVIAHETGHRIGAIRQLRWSDIDMEARIIRWRAENEKTGYEHRTPVTDEVLAVLEEARMQNPKGGNSPVMPAPKAPSRCLDRSRVGVWWDKAQKLAGLEPRRGRGWHSLRRKFASDLMDQPLKVLCELGGWKTAQTVLQCYQRADEDRLRKALQDRRRASIPAN